MKSRQEEKERSVKVFLVLGALFLSFYSGLFFGLESFEHIPDRELAFKFFAGTSIFMSVSLIYLIYKNN